MFVMLLECSRSAIKQKRYSSHGPENGKLLLLGGGITETHASLFKKFSKNDSLQIIIIPTALSDEALEKDPGHIKIKNRFSKLGINNLKVIHTRDTAIANSDEFIEPIKKSLGIFMLGGRTENIIEAYKNTKTHGEMKALLKRGGIIAGVSAGSGAQAKYFSGNGLNEGFEFLEGVIIMNHFLAKNKVFDHSEQILENKENIAVGIDDNTGILVDNNRFEVVGQSYVAIYDGKNYSRSQDSIWELEADSERFYLLQNGDNYNLSERNVESNRRLKKLNLSKEKLNEYQGIYKASDRDFSIEFKVEQNRLIVKNSWDWEEYPIYPYSQDVFFATNRTMWFEFFRNDKDSVVGVQKMKSILQKNVIVELNKQALKRK